MQTFQLAGSAYVPLALGFFGLGVGYFVWGGSLLFRYPVISDTTNRSLGLWGIWMPGFLQFLTGTYILVGITWFHVFEQGAAHTALYMAGLAFTSYGVHWFVLGYRRYIQADVLPDGWMAIAFFLLSLLGAIVFAFYKDWAVTLLFVLLCLIYLSEALVRFGVTVPMGERLIGLWQFLNGILLMYLTYAVTLDFATTYHLPT